MIRIATTKDIPAIVGLLLEAADLHPLSCDKSSISPRKVALTVNVSIGQGLCYVASNEGEGVLGTIVGVHSDNMWSETKQEIQLILAYVRDDYRESSVGGKLLLTYHKRCQEIMTENPSVLINIMAVQPYTNIKDSSLKKLGFKSMDTIYIQKL